MYKRQSIRTTKNSVKDAITEFTKKNFPSLYDKADPMKSIEKRRAMEKFDKEWEKQYNSITQYRVLGEDGSYGDWTKDKPEGDCVFQVRSRSLFASADKDWDLYTLARGENFVKAA